MKESVNQKIRNTIKRGKYGDVFMVSSFPKYNVEYVTKLLAIFEKEGLITRLSKGNGLIFSEMKKIPFAD
jgi:hypothetical protein